MLDENEFFHENITDDFEQYSNTTEVYERSDPKINNVKKKKWKLLSIDIY